MLVGATGQTGDCLAAEGQTVAPVKAKGATPSPHPFMDKSGGEPWYNGRVCSALEDDGFFVHRLASEKIAQGFHQRSASRAMGTVPESKPLLAFMRKNLDAADHSLAQRRTIKHLNVL